MKSISNLIIPRSVARGSAIVAALAAATLAPGLAMVCTWGTQQCWWTPGNCDGIVLPLKCHVFTPLPLEALLPFGDDTPMGGLGQLLPLADEPISLWAAKDGSVIAAFHLQNGVPIGFSVAVDGPAPLPLGQRALVGAAAAGETIELLNPYTQILHAVGVNDTGTMAAVHAVVDAITGDPLSYALIPINPYALAYGQLSTTWCPGDINHDGIVDANDLGLLLGAWGLSWGAGDLDGDGIVGAGDLGILLAAWGTC